MYPLQLYHTQVGRRISIFTTKFSTIRYPRFHRSPCMPSGRVVYYESLKRELKTKEYAANLFVFPPFFGSIFFKILSVFLPRVGTGTSTGAICDEKHDTPSNREEIESRGAGRRQAHHLHLATHEWCSFSTVASIFGIV